MRILDAPLRRGVAGGVATLDSDGFVAEVQRDPLGYRDLSALRQWRALDKALRTTNNGTVAVFGDSITEGQGATNRRDDGYVGQLRSVLQARYGNAGIGFLGIWQTTAHLTDIWTKTGTWSDRTDMYGQRADTDGATATIEITGTGFSLVYREGPGLGAFTYTVDGGDPVTVDTVAVADALATVSVSGLSDGAHTVVVTRDDAADPVDISGIVPTSSSDGVRVDNYGWSGSNSSRFSETLGLAAVTQGNPDVVVIAYSTTEYSGQVALSTFRARVAAAIAAALAAGADVLLLATGPRNSDLTIAQSSYVRVLYDLSITYDVPFIDNFAGWTFAAYEPYVPDDVHPSDEGHAHLVASLFGKPASAGDPGLADVYEAQFRQRSTWWFGPGITVSTAAMLNNYAMFVPIAVPKMRVTGIGMNVTVAAASSAIRLGAYLDDGTGKPGSLLFDAGTVDSTTTGVKTITIDEELPGGILWLCCAAQGGTPTVNVVTASALPVGRNDTASFGVALVALFQASVTGALPTTAGTTGSTGASAGRVMLKAG